MTARAMAGFHHGERVRMFTLTSPGDESAEESYHQLAARWKRFHLALQRRYPAMQFEYFKVVERQLRGHAHLHVLSRGPYIHWRWLREAARNAGFGRIADVRQVGSRAAHYVSKYLAKDMGGTRDRLGLSPLPRWHRRATWSKGWAPNFNAKRAEWLSQLGVSSYTWYLANARPVLVAMRLQRQGYELEPVDYGDVRPRAQAWELDRQEPLRWKSAGDIHQPCAVCTIHADEPTDEFWQGVSRRPHGPHWGPIKPAPPPVYELWPAS